MRYVPLLQVLALDNNNEKAYYRKGCALMKAAKYDPAIECFQKCPKSMRICFVQ